MSLAVIKRASSSASLAEDTTKLIIWAMARIGPLHLGLGSSSERKIFSPDRLHALETLRYDASECAARCMSLAL